MADFFRSLKGKLSDTVRAAGGVAGTMAEPNCLGGRGRDQGLDNL